MTGLEVELNLVDERGDPALKNTEVLEAIADPDFQTELGQFNIEINVAPAKLREGGLATFEAGLRRSLNDAEEKSAEGRRPPRHDRDPADARRRAHDAELAQHQPALRAAERADPGRSRRGHRDLDLTATTGSRPRRTRSCPRRRAPARSSTCRPRRTTSPTYWNASQVIAGVQLARRGELAVPARQAAVARDPDPAVRAGDRHPQRGAQGPGRAAAGLVRRAVDHLGVRPLRGERPLLPGAAADHRGGGPARGPRRRRRAQARRAAAAQRHDLPLEPPGLRHRTRASRTCASRTASWPPGRPSSTRSPTRRSTSGWCAPWPTSERPLWSQMSFSAAEENFHVAAQQGIDAQVYWPGIGHVRATELVLRRLLPLANAGPGGLGRPAGPDRPAARHHRAALPDSGPTAPSGSSTGWRQRGDQETYDALRATLEEYRERMHTNEPVHTWD